VVRAAKNEFDASKVTNVERRMQSVGLTQAMLMKEVAAEVL
jgi:hypothetical protein